MSRILRLTWSFPLLLAAVSSSIPTRADDAAVALAVDWLSPSRLEVRWPATTTRWRLETTTHLASDAVWTPVAVPAPPQNGVFRHTVEPEDQTRFFRLRADPGDGLPPDPALVAPALPDAGLPTYEASTEFLYTGAAPIQTDVAPGTILPGRATVLRGQVRDRQGQPLPGTRIRIQRHPEFGSTLSRADGAFDLVVNGGGDYIVVYELAHHHPAQRRVQTAANRYGWLPTVRLLPEEDLAQAVAAGQTSSQVVTGQRVADTDGERQAMLLVPPGTSAQLVRADDSAQVIDQLSVRITEYTVGPGGPEAMPAILPASTGYTYAVELSADEAAADDVRKVAFDPPLVHYVENFPGFPVGTPVPAGYYDRHQGQWIPAKNGRVLAILGIAGGIAAIDADGDGLPDSADQLAALGITDDERRSLAGRYPAGQTLWRVAVPHFSPWDYNWPYGPPADATPPDLDPADEDPTEEDPCEEAGSSIIECQNQVLGERIPIPGTTFTLNYRSDRQPGFRDAYARRFPLSNATLPASVKAIHLDLQIAGNRQEHTFAPAPGLAFDFVWNGEDAYGRATRGPQPFLARVGYVYDAVYYEPGGLEAAFGAPGTVPMEGIPARQEAVMWQEITGQLGPMDAALAGLGGWTLSPVHWFEPLANRLYRGDGRTRRVSSATASGYRLEYYFGYCLDLPFPGLPFSVCPVLRRPDGPQPMWDLQVGPDNSLYLLEPSAPNAGARVLRVTEDGQIQTIAGGGQPPDGLGDGGPATEASLGLGVLGGLALGADGSLWVTHTDLIEVNGSPEFHGRVRRVAPDGSITTFAGGGRPADGLGDGGPATAARLLMPVRLAVGPDGSVYISDAEQQRVRRVSPDGVITTVAGTGATTSTPAEDVPATEASFDDAPGALAVDPAGNLFVADGERIRRVAPDGRIHTYAGGGEQQGMLGDRGPAVLAALDSPLSLALDPQGNLYFADAGAGRVRVVTPAGIIFTLAGGGECAPHEPGCDYGSPTEASVEPLALAVRGDGSLLVVSHLFAVYRLAPGIAGSHFAVADDEAWELDRFDLDGRHRDTVHTLTGTVVRQYAYDPEGRLLEIREGPEHVTTLVRDAAGRPTAILAPQGLRTDLELNPQGRLARLTLPGERSYRFEYDAHGLLTRVTDPRGLSSAYAYDADGRLTRAEDPAGGVRAFSRTPHDRGYRVVMTTAEGTVVQYDVATLDTGVVEFRNRFADGLEHLSLRRPDETRETRFADGSVALEHRRPDPRWGLQAAFPDVSTFRTPAGLEYEVLQTRTVDLPDPHDPLGLSAFTQTTTLSGDRYQFAWDPLHRTYVETSPEGRRRTMILDSAGRVVSAQLGNLAPVTFQYNPYGRLQRIGQGAADDARAITLTEDDAGLLATVTDPLGQVVTYRHAPTGFLRELIFPDGEAVPLEFDPNHNLVRLTTPRGGAHAFAFSPVNRLTRYDPPLTGPETASLRYEYDRDRQPVRMLTADGEEVLVDYDSVGRPVRRREPAGEARWVYSPDTGQLQRLEGPHGVTVQRTHDGPLLIEEAWSGPFAARLRTTYNSRLLPKSLALDGVVDAAFEYDGDGLLTSAGDLRLDRDADTGLPVAARLGQVSATYAYDVFGALVAQTASLPGLELYHALYTRDRLGRITNTVEMVLGERHTTHHEYDARGRLVRTDRDGAPFRVFDYDANNNRTRVLAGGIETLALYDAADRMLSSGTATFHHDRAGRRVRRESPAGSTSYAMDPWGHLLEVTTSDGTRITYALDAESRRTARFVDGTYHRGYLHHDGRLTAELDPQSGARTVFVYAREAHSPDYFWRDGRTYFLVKDPVGSPLLVLDTNDGTIVQRREYDPFGVILTDSRPGFQPIGFAGGLLDPDTGLTHFSHRDYDADVGRWMTRDPVLFLGGQLNLYAYAYNDPINHLDADGRQATSASGSSTITVTISLNPPPPPAGMDPGYSYQGYKVTLDGKIIIDERFGKRAPDECSLHLKSVTIVENSQMVGDILVTHYWGPPQIIVNAPRR